MKTLITLIALVAALTSGCAAYRMQMGRMPDPTVLDAKLRIGETTRGEVRALLGTPLAEGRSMFPMDSGPRTVWAYAYAEVFVDGVTVRDAREQSVWVYFDGDRYDGYLWFSSLPKRDAR